MNWDAVGAIAELAGALGVVASLAYLAIQIRQNTAQQRREEVISIQQGQNSVLAQLQDPRVMGAFVRGAAGKNPSIEDRARAQNWVIQYLNHFQIVHDLHQSGSTALDEEQYQLWAGFAVAMVAPDRIRQWWYEEDGRLAFAPGIRDLIDQRLSDTAHPPRPITEMWTVFSPDAWESAAR